MMHPSSAKSFGRIAGSGGRISSLSNRLSQKRKLTRLQSQARASFCSGLQSRCRFSILPTQESLREQESCLKREDASELHYARLRQGVRVLAEVAGVPFVLHVVVSVEAHAIGHVINAPAQLEVLALRHLPGFRQIGIHPEVAVASEVVTLSALSGVRVVKWTAVLRRSGRCGWVLEGPRNAFDDRRPCLQRCGGAIGPSHFVPV